LNLADGIAVRFGKDEHAGGCPIGRHDRAPSIAPTGIPIGVLATGHHCRAPIGRRSQTSGMLSPAGSTGGGRPELETVDGAAILRLASRKYSGRSFLLTSPVGPPQPQRVGAPDPPPAHPRSVPAAEESSSRSQADPHGPSTASGSEDPGPFAGCTAKGGAVRKTSLPVVSPDSRA
jgi:hypothetical protein